MATKTKKGAGKKPATKPAAPAPVAEDVEAAEVIVARTEKDRREIAEKITQEFETIRAVNGEGKLVPAEVEAWAKAHRKSAIAGQLNWNDTEAARLYRISQVRRIVQVTVKTYDNSPTLVRAYVSLPSDRRLPNGGYRPLGDAVTVGRRQLIEEAVEQLKRFGDRFSYLPELAPLFAEINASAVAFVARLMTSKAATSVHTGEAVAEKS